MYLFYKKYKKTLEIGFNKVYHMQRYSGIVQSVEQRTVNPYVTGSSPVARAKLDSRSISAMSRTVFSSKTKPFVHL